MGGFLEVNSFCCGVTNVEKGCKIIALFSLGYSLLIFFIASVDQSYIEVTVAYLLLLLTALLVYGVCEKIKFLVILYLVLRAVALALVLAEIMRSLGMRKSLSKDNWLLVFLELGDFGECTYFHYPSTSSILNIRSFGIKTYRITRQQSLKDPSGNWLHVFLSLLSFSSRVILVSKKVHRVVSGFLFSFRRSIAIHLSASSSLQKTFFPPRGPNIRITIYMYFCGRPLSAVKQHMDILMRAHKSYL